MRKWLYLLLFIAALYVVSRLGTKKKGGKYPILKQISETISIVVWGLLVFYILAFLYWLYTLIFK
ncbi:MAG: hypothetical protein GTO24_12340 [candidate division Zixibacteria bacterium]|nr:hypothetical protein [candidate division Zixibacteria bacterium]